MRIITQGKHPRDYKYRCNCHACRSVIEYTKADVKVISDSQRDGTTHSLGPCPFCSSALYDYNPTQYKEPQYWDGNR